jgi:hypothetical protein
MYHERMVENFLADKGVEPKTAQEIRTRIKTVASEQGMFTELQLDYVMGIPELAKEYRDAWNENAVSLLVRWKTHIYLR